MGVTAIIARTMALDQKLSADDALVTATLGGERRAFEELVRRYERPARAVCMAILHDHHLAADAAQDAFVEVYRGLPKLKERSSFGAWMLTIARHRALRMRKMRKPEQAQSEAITLPQAEVDEELMRAVAGLPEQERVVVMLRFFDGHEVAHISGILGRPVSTVTKQLSRAYERLRGAMSREMKP